MSTIKPEGRRNVGSPRNRCMKYVQNDLRELKMKRWRQETKQCTVICRLMEDMKIR
jgi:hypothetical protein